MFYCYYSLNNKELLRVNNVALRSIFVSFLNIIKNAMQRCIKLHDAMAGGGIKVGSLGKKIRSEPILAFFGGFSPVFWVLGKIVA